jgi:hypothetical protein
MKPNVLCKNRMIDTGAATSTRLNDMANSITQLIPRAYRARAAIISVGRSYQSYGLNKTIAIVKPHD